ncbi:uncharacterized protein SPPG_09192 [Spizellomyces punctatus DAOM BR117]|uniref:Uncharacterized protein n=1 Tax=Spizellomyces punctatus (strain DAOM BR117) TaxID=645134 RepID=A0A0L0HH12_SPIPD|nr:uncharacterized protein SPPG_09192 [Spizellomyces punctatus DAOM BR117]KND00069.1 hypothetical protein SPPG_09192 [Spizellomyces punctatus DAOM BR117]|eukprot:XP_016608108.1 hypothetical protein SPPG_09192 [Spizellomyces punctatus DAOM BR117]
MPPKRLPPLQEKPEIVLGSRSSGTGSPYRQAASRGGGRVLLAAGKALKKGRIRKKKDGDDDGESDASGNEDENDSGDSESESESNGSEEEDAVEDEVADDEDDDDDDNDDDDDDEEHEKASDFIASLHASINAAAAAALESQPHDARREHSLLPSTGAPNPPRPRRQKAVRRPSARREAIRLSHAPVKLTGSQFELFTASTGGGIRTGDPYARFLIGPRTERLQVPTVEEAGRSKTDRQMAAKGLMVGKAPAGGIIARSFPVSKRKRKQMQMAEIKAELVSKWERLEDLRLQIIARMKSLKHYHGELQSLKDENKQLKEEHQRITAEMNTRVSEILDSNDDQNRTILQVHRERKQQRAKLERDMARFHAAADERIQELEKVVRERQSSLEEAERDLEELVEFENLVDIDPDAMSKQISAVQARRDALLVEHERKLAALSEHAETEGKESEQLFVDKIMAIIDQEKSQLTSTFDDVLKVSVKINKRLRREIALQQEHQLKIELEIEAKMAEQRRAFEMKRKMVDTRRKVLQLSKFMTCTPDMEFSVGDVFTERNTSKDDRVVSTALAASS